MGGRGSQNLDDPYPPALDSQDWGGQAGRTNHGGVSAAADTATS